MTSSKTGLTEISDAAQRLPQGWKETPGRYNLAIFIISSGKKRYPAEQDNQTYLPVLPMALTAAAAVVARGAPWPALPRRCRGSGQGAGRDPGWGGNAGRPGAWGRSQRTLQNGRAHAEFPRSSSPRPARASIKERESKGQQAPVHPRNRRWEQLAKPPHTPEAQAVPGKVCGALQLQAGSGGARTPSISASSCLFLAAQLKPPFVPKLSPFAPAQPRAAGLTKRAACPLPMVGGTGRGDGRREAFLPAIRARWFGEGLPSLSS